MDELDNLRAKKLRELQERINAENSKSMEQGKQLQQQLDMLEQGVKSILSREAVERYNIIKLAHPDKAMQALLIIGNGMQSGEIKPGTEINDAMFKHLLQQLSPEKKEFKLKKT